jgi:hypothetical protein
MAEFAARQVLAVTQRGTHAPAKQVRRLTS